MDLQNIGIMIQDYFEIIFENQDSTSINNGKESIEETDDRNQGKTHQQ